MTLTPRLCSQSRYRFMLQYFSYHYYFTISVSMATTSVASPELLSSAVPELQLYPCMMECCSALSERKERYETADFHILNTSLPHVSHSQYQWKPRTVVTCQQPSSRYPPASVSLCPARKQSAERHCIRKSFPASRLPKMMKISENEPIRTVTSLCWT